MQVLYKIIYPYILKGIKMHRTATLNHLASRSIALFCAYFLSVVIRDGNLASHKHFAKTIGNIPKILHS